MFLRYLVTSVAGSSARCRLLTTPSKGAATCRKDGRHLSWQAPHLRRDALARVGLSPDAARRTGRSTQGPWGDHRDDRWYVAPGETGGVLVSALVEQGKRSRSIIEANDLSALGQPGLRWDGPSRPRAHIHEALIAAWSDGTGMRLQLGAPHLGDARSQPR